MFIRFLSEDDRVRGFFALVRRGRVSSFPGQVYQVSLDAVRLLEERHIRYRRATDAEVLRSIRHLDYGASD